MGWIFISHENINYGGKKQQKKQNKKTKGNRELNVDDCCSLARGVSCLSHGFGSVSLPEWTVVQTAPFPLLQITLQFHIYFCPINHVHIRIYCT